MGFTDDTPESPKVTGTRHTYTEVQKALTEVQNKTPKLGYISNIKSEMCYFRTLRRKSEVWAYMTEPIGYPKAQNFDTENSNLYLDQYLSANTRPNGKIGLFIQFAQIATFTSFLSQQIDKGRKQPLLAVKERSILLDIFITVLQQFRTSFFSFETIPLIQ